MPSVDINYWAVLVAAAVNMGVGAAWYSGSLFGKQWAKAIGGKIEDMKARANQGYSISIVGALVMAFILSHFVSYAGSTTFADGLVTGFWLWLGFIAFIVASTVVFEGRNWKLWQINAGYWLVVLLINGGLLAAWR